jgi:hypothetical protein
MYMANQTMKVYFIDFVFIQNFLLFVTIITCDLSNATTH